MTLVIKNGNIAERIAESTGTLAPGKKWPDLTEPYNSISPLYTKWTKKSTDLKLEGSNLRIQWPADTLTDWAPKTIPYGVLSKLKPSSVVYILNGDQLIATDGKTSTTYTRAR